MVTIVCHQLRHARVKVELAGRMEAYKCITLHYGTTVTNRLNCHTVYADWTSGNMTNVRVVSPYRDLSCGDWHELFQ